MQRTRADGFTLVELLMVVAIIGVIAAIAIPGLLRSRMSANEASAVASMRAISSAQAAYAASCGSGYYASSLEDLARVPPGGRSFIGPGLDTTNVVKSAYRISMVTDTPAPAGVLSCNAASLGNGYHATAIPLVGGGAREFGTNTTGMIFYTDLPTAIAITDHAVGSGTPIH